MVGSLVERLIKRSVNAGKEVVKRLVERGWYLTSRANFAMFR